MHEPEFEEYLELLTRSLRLTRRQREEIRRELRAHVDEALEHASDDRRPRDVVIREILSEFGDAADLAARLTEANRRRLTMMQGTLTAACIGFVVLSVTTFLTPRPQLEPLPEDHQRGSIASARASEPNPADAQIRAALRQVVPEVTFQDAPLGEVFHWIAASTQINVHVQWNRLADMGVERDLPLTINLKNVTVERVLKLVLWEIPDVDLGYEVIDGVLIITTEEELTRHMEVHVYPVHDLLALVSADQSAHPPVAMDSSANPNFRPRAATSNGDGPADEGDDANHAAGEKLLDLVTMVVEPDSWAVNGGWGSIELFSGSLVVRNTADVHARVSDLLQSLRDSEAIGGA